MKPFYSLIISLFLLMSCAVNNRIVVTDDSQMKTLKLAQKPEGVIVNEDILSKPAGLKVTSFYICEEVKDIRPQVTVSFQFKEPIGYQLSAASIVINLDNENIELNSLSYIAPFVNDSLTQVDINDTIHQNKVLQTDTIVGFRSGKGKLSYLIPENLWDPIIHTNILKYKITNVDEEIEIALSPSEKSMLDKFLGMAIKDRNTRFPAIPEGQKKW